MGSYKLAIQLYYHATGKEFQNTLMLRLKTSLATSGSSKVQTRTRQFFSGGHIKQVFSTKYPLFLKTSQAKVILITLMICRDC